MLTGMPLVREEHDCWQWMTSPLFGNGAEQITFDLGQFVGLVLSHVQSHTELMKLDLERPV
jgi:hypothetical protein